MSITAHSLGLTGALVFQCASCRTILSDSQEFVCTLVAPDGAKCVCLRGLTDARVDRIPTTSGVVGSSSSSSGADGGRSTHYAVCCTSCGAAVGRLYSEVPPALAPVCNLFCLEVGRCLSYELGTAEMRAPGAGEAPAAGQRQQPGGTPAAAAAPAAGRDATLVLELVQRVEQLEASLVSLQAIQMYHNAQLRNLPGYQVEAPAADSGM